MILYLISIIAGFWVFFSGPFVLEYGHYYSIFFLLFPFFSPLLYRIRIRLRSCHKTFVIQICVAPEKDVRLGDSFQKYFAVCLDVSLIAALEIYLQFRFSIAMYYFLSILLFGFPLLHFILQRQKVSYVSNVVYGGLMSLIWSMWYTSRRWVDGIEYLQEAILRDSFKWIIVIGTALVLWSLYFFIRQKFRGKSASASTIQKM